MVERAPDRVGVPVSLTIQAIVTMSSLERLKAATSIEGLAAVLGYKPSNLAYILYGIAPSEKYETFKIPKKSGGFRDICAPTPRLKLLQKHLANALYNCRDEIDKESGLRSLSHGFRRGHSIVTNARPHHKRRYVLNLDLKDYFPTFNFGRVRGFFIKNKAFALNENVATLIAQIACHENQLPQGSPCSPVIADLITHLLDVRLAQIAKKERVTYTRYADDITFSTNQREFPETLAAQDPFDGGKWELGPELVRRINDTGFEINPGKTRMQCRISRQLVTGLTVNDKVNVQAAYYRRTRAMCDALFTKGQYHIDPPLKLPKPAVAAATAPDTSQEKATSATTAAAKPSQVTTKSLGPVAGRLAHIHYVKDVIDQRNETAKRMEKTAFRKLYFQFLFYKNFARLDKPLILTEGKTDNVYLSLAIRHSPAFQPKLGQKTAKGFENALRFFNHLNKTRSILELDGGSGNFKFFVLRYKEMMAALGHKPQAHPVILLLDNDGGAKDILPIIENKYNVTITYSSTDKYFHITDNLYVVMTPHVGKKVKTCIEDMFEDVILNAEIAGKKFNPEKPDITKEYGKHIFAEGIIRPQASTLNWAGFAPLLDRIASVLDAYKPPV